MNRVKDPVCGMEISADRAAATATHKGEIYHFCSTMCKTKFSMNPEKYTNGNQDHSGHNGHGGHGTFGSHGGQTGNGSLGGVGGCHNV